MTVPVEPNHSLTLDTRIAVLCGGLSSEREVSLRSGKNCLEALHRLGYHQAFLLDVDRSIPQKLIAETVQVAFLALHGRYGEDGCIQGLLEMMGIPYTGNRVTASALTMNKNLTKKILKDAGLPVIPSVTGFYGVDSPLAEQVCSTLPFPVMVKPVLEGSSFGMSKVNEPMALGPALRQASQFGNEIMVEAFVQGKSVTVGVFEQEGQPVVTPILELRTKTEWYDFEAKYTHGMTEFILPAELSADTTRKVQDATLLAHRAAGCRGVSRTDFIVTPDEQFYILEINTIPGMTDLGDLPAQANAMGVSYDQLVDCILKTAFSPTESSIETEMSQLLDSEHYLV